MQLRRVESFDLVSSQLAFLKNEYIAVRSILSTGSRIDLYVYYVVVGFSDRWESFEILEC